MVYNYHMVNYHKINHHGDLSWLMIMVTIMICQELFCMVLKIAVRLGSQVMWCRKFQVLSMMVGIRMPAPQLSEAAAISATGRFPSDVQVRCTLQT